jgi:hypothetical protein
MIKSLRFLSLSLVVSLLVFGCSQRESQDLGDSDPASQSNAPLSAPLNPGDRSVPQVAPTQTNVVQVEERVSQLLESFQTAPTNTQTRIQAALETLRSGQEREAISQLKMVDADTDLNPEQVRSIRDMIIAIRDQ